MLLNHRRLCSGGAFALLITLLACSADIPSGPPVRWYTVEQVAAGKVLFTTHCASCHGASAEATPDWRKRDADGYYPPPPLNGTAHAWHHPMSVLEGTIAEGAVPVGGIMPGFANELTASEARATIAYFQSFWPDDTYALWQDINRRATR